MIRHNVYSGCQRIPQDIGNGILQILGIAYFINAQLKITQGIDLHLGVPHPDTATPLVFIDEFTARLFRAIEDEVKMITHQAIANNLHIELQQADCDIIDP
jgi:hypothetical protein